MAFNRTAADGRDALTWVNTCNHHQARIKDRAPSTFDARTPPTRQLRLIVMVMTKQSVGIPGLA